MPKVVQDEPLRDLDWLSEYLGVPKATIYDWRYKGQGPPSYKINNTLRFRRSEVDHWLRERQQE